MMLLYMTVFCAFLAGLSAGLIRDELCYGHNYRIPSSHLSYVFQGKLYHTPNQGSRKLLVDKGQAKDPRIRISHGSVQFLNLKLGDDGILSVSKNGQLENFVKLIVRDCSEKFTKYYGDTYTYEIFNYAEYLEYQTYHMDKTQVMWNRSDPQTFKSGRGQIKDNTFRIRDLTQADNGYYNFWTEDNTMMSRIRLTVKEHIRHYELKENERLFIQNHFSGSPWSVTFKHEDEWETRKIIEKGKLLGEDGWSSTPFMGRIRLLDRSIEIDPVRVSDSGTFEFKDPHGYLVQIVEVTVLPGMPEIPSVLGYTAAIALAMIVCCCVRRCCCKKSSSKKNVSAPADQNPAPASGYSAQPVTPRVSRKPEATSSGLSTYHPVNIHVNPYQPEVFHRVNIHVNPYQPEIAAPARQGGAPAPSAGSDFLSSDTVPTYELKGLNFLSGQPLNSDSTLCNVYNSDKLNFL